MYLKPAKINNREIAEFVIYTVQEYVLQAYKTRKSTIQNSRFLFRYGYYRKLIKPVMGTFTKMIHYHLTP